MAEVQSGSRQPTGVWTLFDKSAKLVKANLKIFLIVNAIPVAVTILQYSELLSYGEDGIVGPSGKPLSTDALWAILALVFFFIFGMVISTLLSTILAFQVSQDKRPQFADIWEPLRTYGGKLFALYIVVGIVIFFGFVALIVPGLIFMRRYVLAPYVMIDRQCGIREAMTISADLSKPYSAAVWSLLGVMILIGLVSGFGKIGMLIGTVASIAFSVAPAMRYLELKKLSPETNDSSDS